MLGCLLLSPNGFPPVPVLTFGVLFRAQLIECGGQPDFVGFAALSFGLKTLLGFGQLFGCIGAGLLEEGFQLGDASSGFGADFAKRVVGGLNLLFGCLDSYFGVGAAFLFDQQTVGEITGGSLSGFKLAAQLFDFGLDLALFGHGGVARLFGRRRRLSGSCALLIKSCLGVSHGDFPKRI